MLVLPAPLTIWMLAPVKTIFGACTKFSMLVSSDTYGTSFMTELALIAATCFCSAATWVFNAAVSDCKEAIMADSDCSAGDAAYKTDVKAIVLKNNRKPGNIFMYRVSAWWFSTHPGHSERMVQTARKLFSNWTLVIIRFAGSQTHGDKACIGCSPPGTHQCCTQAKRLIPAHR